MASQLDLDQGGTFRQMINVWMGPSIGWMNVPAPNGSTLPVIISGTTQINRSTTLVLVNVVGAVTIQLPSARSSTAGDGAIPGLAVATPLVIVDAGGNANAFPITITPFVGETIDSLASIQIVSNFGAYVLRPNLSSGGWTLLQ